MSTDLYVLESFLGIRIFMFMSKQAKIAKRNRKLTDYDLARHDYNAQQNAKKHDELKLTRVCCHHRTFFYSSVSVIMLLINFHDVILLILLINMSYSVVDNAVCLGACALILYCTIFHIIGI